MSSSGGFMRVLKACGRGLGKAIVVTCRFIWQTIKIAAGKMRDGWQIRRQKSRVKAEMKRMRKFKLEIGEFYWEQCELGNMVWDRDIDEVCCDLLRSQRSVAICEGVINDLKEKKYHLNLRVKGAKVVTEAGDAEYSVYTVEEFEGGAAYAGEDSQGYEEEGASYETEGEPYAEGDSPGYEDSLMYEDSLAYEEESDLPYGADEPDSLMYEEKGASDAEAYGDGVEGHEGFEKIEFSRPEGLTSEEPEKTLFDFAGLAGARSLYEAAAERQDEQGDLGGQEAHEPDTQTWADEGTRDEVSEDEWADERRNVHDGNPDKSLRFEDLYVPYGADGEPGYDGPEYDGPEYDGPGYDGPGHDEPGHDEPGHDGPGYDGPGYDGPGYDRQGYDRLENDTPGLGGQEYDEDLDEGLDEILDEAPVCETCGYINKPDAVVCRICGTALIPRQ